MLGMTVKIKIHSDSMATMTRTVKAGYLRTQINDARKMIL